MKEKEKLEQDGKTEQLSAEEFLKSKVIEFKTSMSYYYSFSGHELLDLLEEYSKQNNEDFQLQRLYDWLMNENREPAKTKFTAGTLRNVANEIEFRLKQSNWISVEDRLPELTEENEYGKYSKPVLCKHSDGHHEDCQLNEIFNDEYTTYWSYIQDGDICESVTHWQPLPQPPKQ